MQHHQMLGNRRRILIKYPRNLCNAQQSTILFQQIQNSQPCLISQNKPGVALREGILFGKRCFKPAEWFPFLCVSFHMLLLIYMVVTFHPWADLRLLRSAIHERSKCSAVQRDPLPSREREKDCFKTLVQLG